MSDGGRERASLAVEAWKSFQEWSVPRSAVRSIGWLDAEGGITIKVEQKCSGKSEAFATISTPRGPAHA